MNEQITVSNARHWALAGIEAIKQRRKFFYGTVLAQGRLEVRGTRLVLILGRDGAQAEAARMAAPWVEHVLGEFATHRCKFCVETDEAAS